MKEILPKGIERVNAFDCAIAGKVVQSTQAKLLKG
jgi:hypothetical protein